MLEDFHDALIVALYKNKGSIANCGNYRGISLLSIAREILASVILSWLIIMSEANLSEAQCEFHAGHSMVNMTFSVRQAQEKCIEQNLDLYYIFINLTKAFDTVNRGHLVYTDMVWLPTYFIQIIRLSHVSMTGQVLSNGD